MVVLHVTRAPAVVIDGGRLSTGPTGGGTDDLWTDLRKLGAEDSSVVIEHEVIVADRADVSHILKIVEAAGCDLIVMGIHGLTGLKHRLFGGLTEEVVRRARCPVMVVKGPGAGDAGLASDDVSEAPDAEISQTVSRSSELITEA